MTTKDWKKVGKYKWSHNEKEIKAFMTFGKPITIGLLMDENHVWALFDITDDFNTKQISEFFKTKSAALKFAKSYMRSH